MSIVSISRGCDSQGEAVALEVARRLGYACLSRDIVLDASEIFQVDEPLLSQAIHDAPSFLDRVTGEKGPYVAYVRAALLKFLQEDDVVYHGLAGHFFIQPLPQVLKVRIIADLEDRIRLEMNRSRLSREMAAKTIEEDDLQRRKWSRYMFGVDTADPSLYDLVIHIRNISVDDAADIICNTIQMPRFRTTPEAARALRDLALSAEVEARLAPMFPAVTAEADNGTVTVTVKLGDIDPDPVIRDIRDIARDIRGVRTLDVVTEPVIQYNE